MIELTFLKELILKKTRASYECDICYYWYFLDKGFRFQSYVCNECHDVLLMFYRFAILNINGADYRCIINGISKSDAVNLLKNADLTEKRVV